MEKSGNLLRLDGDSLASVRAQVRAHYLHVRALVAKECGGIAPGEEEPEEDEELDMSQLDAPAKQQASAAAEEDELLMPAPIPLSVPVGLLLESSAYARIQSSVPAGRSSSALLRMFLYVALHCKSVVACRCQPSTKADIVRLVQHTQRCVTLAVGDGANVSPHSARF